MGLLGQVATRGVCELAVKGEVQVEENAALGGDQVDELVCQVLALGEVEVLDVVAAGDEREGGVREPVGAPQVELLEVGPALLDHARQKLVRQLVHYRAQVDLAPQNVGAG